MSLLSAVLSVLGVIATVVLGVWAIRLALSSRYPVRLVFAVEQSIGLLDPLAQAIPDLQVLYGGAPIDRNLILLRACILNDGTRDIAPNMIEEPLAMVLPEGFSWRRSRQLAASPGVRTLLSQTDQILTVGFGLLKQGEHIKVECLVEAPPPAQDQRHSQDAGTSLPKLLKFKHRIADAGEVRPVRLDELQRAAQRSLFELLKNGILLVFMVLVLAVVALIAPSELHFVVPTSDRGPVETIVRPTRHGQLALKAVSGGFRSTVFPDSLFRPPGPRAVVVRTRFFTPPLSYIVLSLPLLVLWIGVDSYRHAVRHRRFRALLAAAVPAKEEVAL